MTTKCGGQWVVQATMTFKASTLRQFHLKRLEWALITKTLIKKIALLLQTLTRPYLESMFCSIKIKLRKAHTIVSHHLGGKYPTQVSPSKTREVWNQLKSNQQTSPKSTKLLITWWVREASKLNICICRVIKLRSSPEDQRPQIPTSGAKSLKVTHLQPRSFWATLWLKFATRRKEMMKLR